MRRTGWLIAIALLAGCSKPQQMRSSKLNVFDVAPDQAPSRFAPESRFDIAAPPGIVAPDAAPAPTPGPQIAYTHAVTYAFTRQTVAAVQARHLALCRQLGPARCLLIKSTLNNGGPDDLVSSEAVLLVDARLASGLNGKLDAIATADGATVETRTTEAEDVTREVVDTDARVRAKQALATRLLAIINGHPGKVGELVEAEQAYAKTQEELDAARGEQAALAQRVAMSRITITYSYNPLTGASGPIRQSIGSAGETLAASIGALVTFLVAALPWALLLAGLVWLFRRLRWRLRWPWHWFRRGTPAAPPAD